MNQTISGQTSKVLNTLDNYFKKQSPKPSVNSSISLLEGCPSTFNVEIEQGQIEENQCVYKEESDENACNFEQLFIMRKVVEQKGDMMEEEDGQSKTNPLPKKIKANFQDEEATKDFRKTIKQTIIKDTQIVQVSKIQKIVVEEESKEHAKMVESAQAKIKYPITNQKKSQNQEKVQQIFNKQPLRVRFSELLSEDQKYSIGQNHIRLLNILKAVDNNIQFVKFNRSSKTIFFAQLQNYLYQHNRMKILLQDLQKLLFIDEHLYEISWAFNQKIKRYDLQIKIPSNKGHQCRAQIIRKKIVMYLLQKQVETLLAQGIKKENAKKWNDNFDPNLHPIPLKPLPSHPASKHKAESNQTDGQDQSKRPIFGAVNTIAQNTSGRSKDIRFMIFSNKSNDQIKDVLYKAIAQKQKLRNVQAELDKQVKIDKQMMKQICSEIMTVYMSKGVTNIFRQTLIEILIKKLPYKNSQIIFFVNMITEMKQIEFLKSVTTANKNVVLQINKTNWSKLIEMVEKFP